MRFTRTYRSLIGAALRVFGAVFLILLRCALLFVMFYTFLCLLFVPLSALLWNADIHVFGEFFAVWLPVFAALVSPILTVVTIARQRTPHEKTRRVRPKEVGLRREGCPCA